MHRIGTIPFDLKDDLVALMFVTSQTRGRWILPKGLTKAGETHAQACLRESMEEAGVGGVVLEDFPMTVIINKQTGDRKKVVPVTYYPLFVTEQVDEWPERKVRQRHWALLSDAARVAYREDYLGLIQQFEALVPWIREAAEARKS